MLIPLGDFCIRNYRTEDAASLARYADHPEVAANLRDVFPHPYTLADAREWIESALITDPPLDSAIASASECIGGIGMIPQEDINRLGAEIGYWLGRPFWGKGIATKAVRAFTAWIFENFSFVRLYANTFSSNLASAWVLEKAGFRLEGRLRNNVIKNGVVMDQLVYGLLKEDIWKDLSLTID